MSTVRYPVKGDLIIMSLGNVTPEEGTQDLYRVLKMNGTIAEVVAMFDIKKSQEYGTSPYAGSTLDTALNTTWYNTLSTTAKKAIVDKNITQSYADYSWDVSGSAADGRYIGIAANSNDYMITMSSTISTIGTRHIYALDILDIMEYLGVTKGMVGSNTTLNSTNVWNMFWNTTSKPSGYNNIWLRSKVASTNNTIWEIHIDRGTVDGIKDGGTGDASRPAFQIDLSKIDWSFPKTDALTLTPRVYGKDLTWNVLPKNVVDTVSIEVTDNTLVESTDIDTITITSGTVRSSSVTLPLNDSQVLATNNSQGECNRSNGLGWEGTLGKYYVETTIMTGSVEVDVTSPITSTPNIMFTLTGTTTYLQRGKHSIDEIKTAISSGNIFTFIETNKYGSEELIDNKAYDTTNRANLANGLILDFNQLWVPNFAWVRYTTGSVPKGMEPKYYNVSGYKPPEDIVLTNWDNLPGAYWHPPYDNWTGYDTTNSVRQGPYQTTQNVTSEYNNEFIPIKDDKVSYRCQVTKLSDYKLRIDYSIPIRYGYLAAARTVNDLFPWVDAVSDSYGFKVVISKIEFKLKAWTLNEDTENVAYSRVTDSQLTTDVVNNNIFNFNTNPFITKETYYETKDNTWDKYISQEILNKYVVGKYIVECKVPMQYVIDNNISINTQLKVKLQNGSYITRDNNVCIFQVKNIEKSFDKSSFNCTLKLLELTTGDIIDTSYFITSDSEIFIDADYKYFIVYTEVSDSYLVTSNNEMFIDSGNKYFITTGGS